MILIHSARPVSVTIEAGLTVNLEPMYYDEPKYINETTITCKGISHLIIRVLHPQGHFLLA